MADPDPRDYRDGAGTGLLYLVVFLVTMLVIILAGSMLCQGGEVTLEWSANPGAERVGAYRVYRLSGGAPELLGVTTGLSLTVTAAPGERLAVAAYNGQEGDLSDPVEVPVPPVDPGPLPPPAMVTIRVYQFSGLSGRREIATLYVEKQEADFFQLGIETP